MKQNKHHPGETSALRRRAEERLKERSKGGGAPTDTADLQRLLHELQVHQIELELQNEELQRARTEIEAGLERYTDLYEFAPVGYLALAPDGTIRKVNLTGARLLRQDRARLVGRRLAAFVSPECRPAVDALLAKVFAQGCRDSCDVVLSAGTQEPLHARLEATASADRQECRAVLMDHTDRWRFEETLRFRMALMDCAANHALDELLRKALDEITALTASPIGFYHFVDADQQNLSLQAWSTRTTAEFCTAEGRGQHYPIAQAGVWVDCVRERRPVIHNDYAALPHRKGLPAGHAPVLRELLVPVLRADRIVAIIGVGNKPTDYTPADVGIVAYLADVAWEIIERKRADETIKDSEQRYREAAAALHEADRHKNRFLAMLSHELRNPLAPIRNSLYVLARAVPGGEQANRALAVIDRQVGQLARLIDDLLDVTRISEGKIHLRFEALDLGELIRRTAEDHRPAFAARGIELEVAVGPEIVPICGDRMRLAQAVGNLLTNAAKFSPRGSRTTVELIRDEQTIEAVVRVLDGGAGISADVLPRLFQAFVQADRTLDRSRGGLGLGLAVVKGLVEQHGGSVHAESAGPDQGAEFRIRLPLGESPPPAASVDRRTAPVRTRRVLVIEDNIDAADTLREVLELDGHEVVTVHDGPAGLEAARRFGPEVVLCDIGLPVMDGYAVARAFRADELLRATYLVALTGYALPEDLTEAHTAGFDHHLAKPSTTDALRDILAALPACPTENAD